MKIRYTEHLKLRLKLRDIPYDMPEEVYKWAEERYYDTSTSYYIAIKRLHYAGKARNMELNSILLRYTRSRKIKKKNA